MAVLAAGLQGGAAQAASLYAADGFELRWDNSLRYSAAFRLDPADTALIAYPNSDDGDRNFAAGLVSNRFDLVSVLNAGTDSFGLQAGASAWYDSVYQARTANTSPATYNAVSVPATQFPRATRHLEGIHADLGDTFLYGNFAIDEVPVSLRVGRQTLLWGESLFFGQNGIAAAMAPVDYDKSIGTPDAYSRNVFLPVGQVSLTVQPRADISLAAYYQFEGRATRLPGVGSYFSSTDFQGDGAERAFLTGGQYITHGKDETARADGQYGVSLHAAVDELDLGFYALRFNSKYPVTQISYYAATPLTAGNAGEFRAIYPAGIDVLGASFSTYLEGSNLAGEISTRRNMPLVSVWPVSAYAPSPLKIIGGKGYAEGDTIHAQVSSVTTLSRGGLWDSADFSMEIAANGLLAVAENSAAFNPQRTRFAASARALFKPHYFEVLPNLDTALVLGAGYNIAGRSSVDYYQNAGTGDIELGASFTYRSVWKADVTLTSFIGSPFRQYLADRDFVMISLERTL